MRSAFLVVPALAALTLAGAVPALASTSARPATTTPPATSTGSTPPRALPAGDQRVSLALAPRDAAGLSRLARTARTLTPAVREARRKAALPGPARATEVADRAVVLGLTVLDTSDTSVSVAGSPALVHTLFGSARANRSSVPTAQALPDLPPSLTGLVLVAAGGDETRPSHLPRNKPDGSLSQVELQSVYGVPASTTPPTATAPTVATLQFSNWKAADLTSYVKAQHIYGSSSYDPIANGGFSSKVVDGGPTDSSGSGEVSLDQEAIATMAPSLRQRAYFTGQSDALAQSDAINQVASDASSRHILTLSTSYGNCEADAYDGSNDPTLKADEDAINNLLAAGVTFFAPSGDDGSVDCPDTHPGVNTVDAPAALPNAVAVGGTSVQTGTSGTTQTVWNDGAGGGATGGGYSTLTTRPAYQNGAVSNAKRGVPDIAMDADPATGLDQYDSTPGGCGGSCAGSPTGGTSLATPLAVASLASVLASRGATSGVGDIHPLLYAASSASSITDVTSGNNGAFHAGPGWDATTGLGAPRWSSLVKVAAGTTPYVAINPVRVVDTRNGKGSVHNGTLAAGRAYTFRLVNSPLPTGQAAYAFNVTAINPARPGYLKLTPACGSATGTSSLVNYQPGKTVANFVIAPEPSGCNAFTLTSAGSAVNVALDAVGYYTSGFTRVGPTRIADTRSGLGGTTGPIAAGSSASFTVAGAAGIPTDATAVAVNITAIGPTRNGYLEAYPHGTDRPTASNINYIPGVTKAEFAVVQLPANGKIDLYSAGSHVNTVIDVYGYYPASSTLVTQAPVRVLDTRSSSANQSLPSPLAAGTPYPVQVTGGAANVPADAQAVLVSLTAIHGRGSTGVGYLAAYPAGQSPPIVSNINYVSPDTTVANFAIVKIGTGGKIDLITHGSPIDTALDVVGYVPAAT